VYKLDRWTFKWKKMFDNLSLKKIDKNLASFQLRKTSKHILSSKMSNNLITLCNTSTFHFEFLIHLIFLK
jgi:hypothetical protein